MRTHPIVEYYQALRDSAPCLSRAATLPKGTKLGLGKRRAPGNTIILSQPYRRRVSTDRLNREGSQLAASLEGEPGPTPAGKTLPHSFPETSRFRRERAREGVKLQTLFLYLFGVYCMFHQYSNHIQSENQKTENRKNQRYSGLNTTTCVSSGRRPPGATAVVVGGPPTGTAWFIFFLLLASAC